MIDLHSHILYGVDDGARTLAESLELGRMAAAAGTRVIAATPHGPGSVATRVYDADLIAERAAEIEAALRAEGIELQVVAGTEINFDAKAVDALRHSLVIPYAGTRTVLLEPTYGFTPSFESVVFAIQALGYRVLLAHPERVGEVRDDPNCLIPLIERGVLMQLTAEALTGAQGGRMQRLCETLVTHNFVHVIASDSHRPTQRPPVLGPARDYAAHLLGEAAANALVEANPAAILADRPIHVSPTSIRAAWRFW